LQPNRCSRKRTTMFALCELCSHCHPPLRCCNSAAANVLHEAQQLHTTAKALCNARPWCALTKILKVLEISLYCDAQAAVTRLSRCEDPQKKQAQGRCTRDFSDQQNLRTATKEPLSLRNFKRVHKMTVAICTVWRNLAHSNKFIIRSLYIICIYIYKYIRMQTRLHMMHARSTAKLLELTSHMRIHTILLTSIDAMYIAHISVHRAAQLEVVSL
jgi:hypothetical protein